MENQIVKLNKEPLSKWVSKSLSVTVCTDMLIVAIQGEKEFLFG